MNLNNKMVIDFKEFLKTGKFDYLKIGKTKEWIINNFPDPDFFTGKDDKIYQNDIWRYGNVELIFHEEKLILLHSKYLDENDLNGGEYLEIKKWFLEKSDKINLLSVIEYLNVERINFSKKTNQYESKSVRLELESGVHLGFILEGLEDENDEEYTLRSETVSQNEFIFYSFSLRR
ncbi:hypothetical protein [Bernardetia sp. MNP-M8]|uniref:hypothetical protein n=1 Tax=Bernardetia sp. MNP-M8 TaxID=3127470 RepID=UPI0030CD2024